MVYRKSQRKKSLMFCITCIILFIIGITAGVSYAYFSDSAKAENILNFGRLRIQTGSNEKVAVTLTGNATTSGKLAPNDTVTITGSVGLEEGSVDAYIRMKIKVYKKNTTTEIESTFNQEFMEALANIASGNMKWFVVGGYMYLGNKIISGQTFDYKKDNTDKVMLTDKMVPIEFRGMDVDVIFVYQAIQSAGMGLSLETGYSQPNAEAISELKEAWYQFNFEDYVFGKWTEPQHKDNSVNSRGVFSLGEKVDGKYTHIEFGVYPQTRYVGSGENFEKTNETYTLIENKSLNYGNYVGENVTYTVYRNREDGEKYIKMKTVNPYDVIYKYSDGVTIISGSTNVYFKLEPIIWKIMGVVDNSSGTVTPGGYNGTDSGVKLLLNAENILTTMVFSSSNKDYDDASNTVKTYLNGMFFEDAFSKAEKSNIMGVNLVVGKSENASDLTTYVKGDNKIFLLSRSDLINGNYFANDVQRLKEPTDYACANYVYMNTTTKGGYWWSRSSKEDGNVYVGTEQGGIWYAGKNLSSYGVVPALFLSI